MLQITAEPTRELKVTRGSQLLGLTTYISWSSLSGEDRRSRDSLRNTLRFWFNIYICVRVFKLGLQVYKKYVSN